MRQWPKSPLVLYLHKGLWQRGGHVDHANSGLMVRTYTSVSHLLLLENQLVYLHRYTWHIRDFLGASRRRIDTESPNMKVHKQQTKTCESHDGSCMSQSESSIRAWVCCATEKYKCVPFPPPPTTHPPTELLLVRQPFALPFMHMWPTPRNRQGWK